MSDLGLFGDLVGSSLTPLSFGINDLLGLFVNFFVVGCDFQA